MNREMLEIYRQMLESKDLKREDAELIKANLEEEKKQNKEILEQLYDDDGVLKHSAEIQEREDYKDEINELLNLVIEVTVGRDFSKKEEQEETDEEPEIDETEEYDQSFKEDEPEEEYEEPEDSENEEELEEEQPEKNEIAEKYEQEKTRNLLEGTAIEITDFPDDKYQKEAMEVIEGREDLGDLKDVMAKGERSARLVLEKIGGVGGREIESNQEQIHDYDKDERTR